MQLNMEVRQAIRVLGEFLVYFHDQAGLLAQVYGVGVRRLIKHAVLDLERGFLDD